MATKVSAIATPCRIHFLLQITLVITPLSFGTHYPPSTAIGALRFANTPYSLKISKPLWATTEPSKFHQSAVPLLQTLAQQLQPKTHQQH